MKQFICLECPRGCRLSIDEQTLAVSGNACPKGEAFARAELTNPLRVLTTTVRIDAESETMLPVRTLTGIPKGKLFAAMDAVRAVRAKAPVRVGEILVQDLAGTGVPLIATKQVKQ